ncbi:DnaD domain protein [Paucilactobacillus suebicus]|uniref:Replicative DNA helicase loader DnaB n=1 Tax=Paucilactobacillus suebicus DSM 5007 = KCTC 3549 TaxID=1423807 RepID=A0A0R1W6E7_9LACO|nr:DnaD domain protein [Paucilactobacillus suebicus]KRM13242.1 replicative DNA helicase loader DnaB [Paucilactobacillus suebicus DSM 5007 = KCTC 3549]
MTDDRKKLTPQTGLIVSLSSDYRKFSEQTLVEFYQPVMGTTAFSLLFALKKLVKRNPTLSDRISHTVLLNQLGIDINQLEESVNKLQGLGLVQTFETVDQIGHLIVYELQPTLTQQDFLNDDLLSVLLLEVIGESGFNDLVSSSTQFQLDTARLTPTTKTFFDSFHVNQGQITDLPSVINENREKFIVNEHRSEQIPGSDFDFELLTSLLGNQPISTEEIDHHKELIRTENALYGIDETEMARQIMKATNITTNQIDEQRLKKSISASFELKHQSPQDTNRFNHDVQQSAPGKTEKVPMSHNEQLLVNACKSYAPMDFLENLLSQKGGYVPDGSQRVLQSLVSRQVLKKSVINMLIYYVIQDRNSPTLSQNFVDTVANSWAQAGITSPEEALQQIKKFHDPVAKTPRKSSSAKKQKSAVTNSLPDWAQDGYQRKQEKMSDNDVAKIKQQLDKLKKQQESEE